MSTKNNTRSALRAALKQEDAALTERLAGVAQTPATALAEKVSDLPADASGAPAPSVEAADAAPATFAKAKAAPAKAKPRAAKATLKPPATTSPVVEGSSDAAGNKVTSNTAQSTAPVKDAGVTSKKRPAKAAAADAEAGKKEKGGKVVRDSFSIPTSEHGRLKALRVELGKAGRLASKSEVLRAGLILLGDRSTAEVAALLDALPPVVKGKRSKKH